MCAGAYGGRSPAPFGVPLFYMFSLARLLPQKRMMINSSIFKQPCQSTGGSGGGSSGGGSMTEEEFEPYVRRKRAETNNRKKMQGLNEQEQNLLRNSINSRERRRMHELNEEFESLRECLPYSNDANCRRMSKANTLLLASNWIKQLTNANHKLQTELNAAREQINTLLKMKQGSSSPERRSESKCSKCNQNVCFSVSCLTST